MSVLSVVAENPGRMTPERYKAERAKLAKNRSEAGVRFEQELARLFYRSGWTQAELAKAEGKSKAWVDYQVRFGRFLDFSTSGGNSENPAFSLLTERRFRDFWARTEGDERERFREVLHIIEGAGLHAKRRPPIMSPIRKAFADDGQFHKLSTIAKKVGATEEQVADCLVQGQCQGRIRFDKRRNGKHDEYQVFRTSRPIPSAEIATKLKPIVDALQEQAARAAGTVSNADIARQVALLRKMIDEWLG